MGAGKYPYHKCTRAVHCFPFLKFLREKSNRFISFRRIPTVRGPMAENGTQPPSAARSSATAGPAVHLRPTRAEVEFRNDTRNLQRRERDRFSNVLWNMVRLEFGPRTTLTDLVGRDQEAMLDYRDDRAINSSVNYYHQKSDHSDLLQVLKFFTAYLMQQARKDPDPAKQQFLLFKAVDLARMIVQYSPMAVNTDAEGIVFAIFIALGTDNRARFGRYMEREQTVLALMRRLQTIPNEMQLRLQLADALVEQTSYLDALVQYQMLLRVLAHRGDTRTRERGWVLGRMGDLFQSLSELSAANLRDGRKLGAFIDRFNRSFAEKGHGLPALHGTQSAQLNRVRQGLLREANRWSLRAAAAPQLEARVRARMCARVGANLNALGRYKEALGVLEEGHPNWKRVPDSASAHQEHLQFLREVTTAALHLKNRAMMDWATREASEVNGKLAGLDKARRDKEAARAAMLG